MMPGLFDVHVHVMGIGFGALTLEGAAATKLGGDVDQALTDFRLALGFIFNKALALEMLLIALQGRNHGAASGSCVFGAHFNQPENHAQRSLSALLSIARVSYNGASRVMRF